MSKATAEMMLEARTTARFQTLQTLRFEAAYPDLSAFDRLALEVAREVLLRLDKRDNPGRVAQSDLLPIAPDVLELIERLANFLGETHALDKSNQHYDDDLNEQPCSYCQAIAEAASLLQRAQGETS